MSLSRKWCRPRANAHRPAFTLLEMLVVLAIISSLAMIVGPSVLQHVRTANTTAARSQLEMLTVALESYRIDNARYPSTEEGLEALRVRPDGITTWRGPYLRRNVPLDPWGRVYTYRASPTDLDARYELYTLGRDGAYGGDGEDEDLSAAGDPISREAF